jgi:hypothetical protein
VGAEDKVVQGEDGHLLSCTLSLSLASPKVGLELERQQFGDNGVPHDDSNSSGFGAAR